MGSCGCPATTADWVPVHVTVNRVELEPDTYAGLVSLRLPTDDELAAAGLIAETPTLRPSRILRSPGPPARRPGRAAEGDRAPGP